jgi:uncharacterized membrane protein
MHQIITDVWNLPPYVFVLAALAVVVIVWRNRKPKDSNE